jgi:hypothetical protein
MLSPGELGHRLPDLVVAGNPGHEEDVRGRLRSAQLSHRARRSRGPAGSVPPRSDWTGPGQICGPRPRSARAPGCRTLRLMHHQQMRPARGARCALPTDRIDETAADEHRSEERALAPPDLGWVDHKHVAPVP